MTHNGIGTEAQNNIIQGISSFAMYGFPESHAASFALIAYASAYLKVHYLAAFTCAILNNQPMGFYSAAVLIKDAQRHGLRVAPLCSARRASAHWKPNRIPPSRFVLASIIRGLQRATADTLVRERTLTGEFHSIDDLALRVPELNRRDLVSLARIGALNSIGEVEHRRDALWQVEEAARTAGPLLRGAGTAQEQPHRKQPLRKMNDEERLAADYAGTGITTGPHLMAYHRLSLRADGIRSAAEMEHGTNHQPISIAGCVIARQRPGTAKGFVFLSLEDETGIANVIIAPDVFEANRLVVTRSCILRIDGQLQLQDGVVHQGKADHSPRYLSG